MNFKMEVEEAINNINYIAKKEKKLTGFCIGNTAKIDNVAMYLMPIRKTQIMVFGGVIVYCEEEAKDIINSIDGKIDYVLVDAEKKIPDSMSITGEPANVERTVRENINKSTLWSYKGNDLSVEAVDIFLAQLYKNDVRGIGGKKISIIGAGNLGSKLALKLVERGANVVICRRNRKALINICEALNLIKPKYTKAKIEATTDKEVAVKNTSILIGASQGIPVITSSMVEKINQNAIIVDIGKGTVSRDALVTAEKRGLSVFRLDVSSAFEGLIQGLWATENQVEKRMGRRQFQDIHIVSGGLLGRKDEIVVDNIWNPGTIYGTSNGKGDFKTDLTADNKLQIQKLKFHLNL